MVTDTCPAARVNIILIHYLLLSIWQSRYHRTTFLINIQYRDVNVVVSGNLLLFRKIDYFSVIEFCALLTDECHYQ